MLIFWIVKTMVLGGLTFFLAKKEIQTEGEYGWAEKLPTWRIKSGVFVTSEQKAIPLRGYKYHLSRWIVKISGKEITGYHLFLVSFLLFMVHIPLSYLLLFGVYSWRWECVMLSTLPLLLLFEDFLWFVLNPDYGLKKFRKGEISWHKNWWGPVPDFYWWYAVTAALLIYFGWPALLS